MQTRIRILIIGAVLVGISLFGFYWVQQYMQRSRASASPPTASLIIAGPKVNPGDFFDLIVQINPNLSPFYSFDVAFTYDPTKVSFAEPDPTTIVSNITPLSTKGTDVVDVELLTGPTTTNIDTAKGIIRISGLRTNADGEPFIGRDQLQMVKIAFVMKDNQQLPLEFKWVDPDPTKTSQSDSFQKADLTYNGEVAAASSTNTSSIVSTSCGADDFSGVASPDNFIDDFSEATINTKNFGTWTSINGSVSLSNGSATISNPASTKSGSTSFFPNKEVEGDFSAEVTLKELTTLSNKSISAFYLNFRKSDWSREIHIGKDSNEPGILHFYWIDGKGTDEKKDYGIGLATPVKLKIERVGATISTYYDKGAGYQLLKSLDNYYAGVGTISVNLDTWGPEFPATTGSFDDFKLTKPALVATSLWDMSSTGSYASANGSGVLSLPAGSAGASAFLTQKNKVSGDFAVEVLSQSISTNSNNLSGVFALSFQTSTEKLLKIYRTANQSYIYTNVNNGAASADAVMEQKDISLQNATPVKLKIERVGGTVKMYYDLLKGNGYQLARQFDNFYTGEGVVRLVDESTGPSFPQMSSTFDNYKLTCMKQYTSVAAVGAVAATLAPGVVQPTKAYNSLTPIPTIMGSSGKEGTTTFVRESGDLLYINSLASYASPFRYEQSLKLAKGTYELLIAAKIYVRKERGVVVALICNEDTCGKKRRDQALYVSPVFPVKTDFSELSDKVVIPDDADGKQYIFRIFCEDGSECEFDYISMEDAWGSQVLRNNHFGAVQQYTDLRMEPSNWVGDATSDYYGSVDPNYGYKGALMINNSAK